MPLEAPLPAPADRAKELNARYRHHGARDILAQALSDPLTGRIAMVSSFGAESVVLLHLLSTLDRTVPVLFLNTEMLFEETIQYQRDISKQLGLTDVRVISPDRNEMFLEDNDALLWQKSTDACCALRKTRPLEKALSGFDAWITGRKRYQSGTRAQMGLFEADGENRIKVNPMAHFTPDTIREYMENNNLPRHPLVKKGFASLGCAPCTSRVRDGEDPRAGRWRGQDKTECGIHFENGKMVRTPVRPSGEVF
ncbi:phosphoadenylyl-sulfate reductase [Halocynthiibacter styelae]|uniref:Adenosine 5'-phosphosulfate reductase n=1 Tax=Halocynthiibacter styelae TaxID=2761955 RepID=A0A8J7IYX4_9RHOB|nr:phosphoadenylyl-sulfate reductase [Paenihalocynthiibacter styelae]MBI1494860.1 phosphoadenylyl-sulfate reductase [Paenihalocynthiibacter styelae]